MVPRILHLLSQRPGLTGSGATLNSLVRFAELGGWEQRVVVGTPASDPRPDVGGLDPGKVHPLIFEQDRLDFPVPGMSDVMPYPSTRFSDLRPEQLRRYRQAFRARIGELIREFRPNLVHSHHVWLMSSLVKTLAPRVPQLIHCHSTGLRQLRLCPHLRREVRTGCSRADVFVVLNQEDAWSLVRAVGVHASRVIINPSGYDADLFHPRGRGPEQAPELVYVGKFAEAKGLPSLLDAVEALSPEIPGLRLHVAGTGSGEAAVEMARRMDAMPQVQRHGQLEPAQLAPLMRRASVCVLPSFYEGVPLVLVEGLASGCRVVATKLAGIRDEIHPLAPDSVELVDPPRIDPPDRPRAEDLPAFVERLAAALRGALGKPAPAQPDLDRYTGQAAFLRMQEIWMRLSAIRARAGTARAPQG